MNFINISGNLHDKRILDIISLSQYMPTEEKMNSLAHKYEIMSIATKPSVRSKGVASKLITFASKNLNCSIIKAETDDDAIGFYRKCGFQIVSLGKKYPDTVRYLCTLKLP